MGPRWFGTLYASVKLGDFALLNYSPSTHCFFRGGTERGKGERKGQRQGEKGEKDKEKGQSERIGRHTEVKQDNQTRA